MCLSGALAPSKPIPFQGVQLPHCKERGVQGKVFPWRPGQTFGCLLWCFLSPSWWPHLNTIPSAANPTQELFLSVALHFSSITTCLHANLLRSQQPHHPIYTLRCQIITLLCQLQRLMCFKTKSTAGCPGEEWACVAGALRGVPSWGCCRAAPILGD